MATSNIDTMEQCAKILSNARHVVCFTGAGMSAESGISTFRGGSGLWSGVVGSLVLGWFGTPVGWKWTPGTAWTQYIDRFYNPIRDAQPNEGHKALVRLRNYYSTMAIVTQNVDGLHQRAGFPSDRIFEVHGTVRRSRCIANGHIYDFGEETNLPRKSPRCRTEGCNSTLRPDCVLFTEGLPTEQWTGAVETTEALGPNDVMIIVGTSAEVYPAAGLPELASKHGATLIDVNLVQTKFSRLSNYLFLEGTAGKVLPQLVTNLIQLKQNQ